MITEEYIRGGTQKKFYEPSETIEWDCPLCAEHDSVLIKEERGALKIVSCVECGLIRVNPRLHHPDEVYHGKEEIYREEFRLVTQGTAPHHRDWNYRLDLELLEKLKPTGEFLDIGTNTGSFLRLARNRGWTLTGIEPSPQLGRLAREWWGLDILEGFVEKLELPERHFDIVTMTDVFEHVVNPREVLGAIRKTMKPDGVLFIKVPNGRFNKLKFFARRLLGKKNADDFDSYEHVCHYTEETLRKMLAVSGFTVDRTYVETPIQIPVWHHHVGHYYQHASPWSLAWKTNSARTVLYEMARVETAITGKVNWLAPTIGCVARVTAG